MVNAMAAMLIFSTEAAVHYVLFNLYLDKIQINQMIAHLQGKLVEKTPNMLLLIGI
jgi:hypothetical protein